MPAPPDKQMLGGDGVMRFIDSTSAIPAASGYLFDYVVVNSPAVVSSLVDENNLDLVGSGVGLYNISGKTLQSGTILIGKNGARIRGVTVTGGSVIGYQSRDRGNLFL